MFISLNWIRDFVNVPQLTPQEIASRFTLATAEVEGVKAIGVGLEQVQVVEVKAKKPHPEADKLNLVTFKMGSSEEREVVCGAGNVREGMKVFFAPIGTKLPNGLVLEAKKIRGILSQGMLCSESELGLGEGHAGLLELPQTTPLGQSFFDYSKLQTDVILEVDNKSLTHRPDLWGMYGLAREFSAQYLLPLKNIFDSAWKKKCDEVLQKSKKDPQTAVEFSVENESACWTYLGLTISQLKVKESPAWIKQRLEAVGLKPKNSVVDISNYVMWELGHPNHIFDADKIAGRTLRIETLKSPTSLHLLDQSLVDLQAGDTVISDEQGAVVLAGIMGGERTSVTLQTTRVFLEVANWSPVAIRKTSTRLGLRSDSSQRFEKTLDSNHCSSVLLRLMELIIEVHPEATVSSELKVWKNESTFSKPLTLTFSRERLDKILGIELPALRISEIFMHLGFTVDWLNPRDLKVVVPTWRTTKDISCIEDLVEELGRIVGFDNIPSQSPLVETKPIRLASSKVFQRRVQDFMVNMARAHEVMTYPLVGPTLLKKYQWPEMNEELVLLNALSEDHDRMRPSVIPSFLESCFENTKHYSQFRVFELSRMYKTFDQERNILSFAVYHKEHSPFIEVMNCADRLLSSFGFSPDWASDLGKFSSSVLPKDWIGVHPFEYQHLRLQGKFLGAAFTVHPLLVKKVKSRGFLSVFFLDVTDIESRDPRQKHKFTPLAKYPQATFDVSVVTSTDTAVVRPLEVIQQLKLPFLKSVLVRDVFVIDEQMKSITIQSVFENPDATLEPAHIKNFEQQIVQNLEKAGFHLRS
jgi:phenylalanyl-tRNA synthetase beta chain